MRWSDIPWRPSDRVLRQFAGLWTIFFGLLAAWQGLVRHHPTAAVVLGVLAVTVGPLGLLWPSLVRPIFVTWMVLAFPIGWAVSTVILTLMFFLVFTPVALLFRLIGRDALGLKPKPGQTTYWLAKPPVTDPRRYLYQS